MRRLFVVLTTLAATSGLAADPAANLPKAVTDADFLAVNMAAVQVGRLLFWDKILSGNRNIACASCHHPRFGTSDGLSLGIGEGGIGIGPERRPDSADLPEQRIPRNAPALWNVGAKSFSALFADGRIEVDPSRPSGFRTPLEDEMVKGFDSLLSAQTMFPVLSPDEMAGHYEENDISTLVRQGRVTGPDGAWAAIAARVADIPQYSSMFRAAYPEIAAGRAIEFTDVSNAIAAYMAFDFRSDTSPFDSVLRGTGQLTGDAAAGMNLFYGKGRCATCHSGSFLTDMKYHAMGDPQIGPGKAERFESHQRDTGRQRVSNDPADAFAFRTPSLRNVTLTSAYGHAGSFSDLRAYLKQHEKPGRFLLQYDIKNAVLPKMMLGKPDLRTDPSGADFVAIAAAVHEAPMSLSDYETDQILAFLKTLEDPVARVGGRLGVPEDVPSGLPVDR